MKVWAHRGCSQMYPENTLLAFEKALSLNGLAGIELDIQRSRDGHLIVCHDERVDRTTGGSGMIAEMTLSEIKALHIDAGDSCIEHIPTMEEVLTLFCERAAQTVQLNIELKNNVVPSCGMEATIIELVHYWGLQDRVVYSSFYARSLELLHTIDPCAEIGVLDYRVSDCLYKRNGGCGATALHPYWNGIDIPPEQLKGYTVRGWFSGHLYPEKPTGTKLDLEILEKRGLTDVFLNEPERYLSSTG